MDSTKAAFGKLGPGYATWINLANESLEEDKNMDKVFDNSIASEENGGTFDTFVSSFFHNNLATYGVKVRRVGPSTTLTLTQSDFYPAIADAIKKNFGLSSPSSQSALGQLASTVIIQHVRWARRRRQKRGTPSYCSFTYVVILVTRLLQTLPLPNPPKVCFS